MKKLFSLLRTGLVVAGCGLLGAILFTSCSKSNSSDVYTPVSALAIYNLVPDKSGIGITLSGTPITEALSYTSFTGGYLNIYPGNRNIQALDKLNSAVLTNTNFNFDSSKYYSLYVTGAMGAYSNIVSEDNYSGLSSTNGKAYVKYVNAVFDSVNSPRVVITSVGGTPVADEFATYRSVSEFKEATPGDVTVKLTDAGGGTTLATRTFAVEAQKAYTILLIGIPGSSNPDYAVQIKYVENGRITP